MKLTRASGGKRPTLLRLLSAGVLLAAATLQAQAASVTLCAEAFTQTLPGNPAVPMWGYRDCSIGSTGVVSAPGPGITVLASDPTLSITLVNNLTVPTSIVLAGQSLPVSTAEPAGPIHAVDVVGASCTPADPPPRGALSRAAYEAAVKAALECRVRSFTGETAPGATQTYTFSNLKPGTYLYQSGTHQQVQVQMGLFGMVKKDATPSATLAGRFLFANPDWAFDVDVPVVLSEIDPDLHARVAATLGSATPTSWKAGSNTTLDYNPRYFLVNGKPFDAAGATDLPVTTFNGARVVLRMANAGLKSRSMLINNGTWQLLTEDGNAYPAPREQYSAFLPAGKTADAQIIASVPATGSNNSLALFDRRGGTDNADANPLGGQVARLVFTNAGPAPNLPPVVNAGADQTVPALSATLAGTVTDDGVSLPLTTTWTQVSGPGTATFATPTATSTAVSFTAVGSYTLRLTANDVQFNVTDDVVVNINTAPVVNAGADQTVTVATLANPAATLVGTVTDDGFPGPFTSTWSLVSGPGTVTFGTPAALSSTATFSAAGTYTLRLTANDGQLTGTDDVVVTVDASKHVGDLDQTRTLLGTLPWTATVTIQVENALHGLVNGATVTGTWSGGGIGGTTCVTTAVTPGRCTVIRLAIPFAQTSNTFTVTNVTGATAAATAAGPYNATLNHDPDLAPQNSNGTTIVVPR